MTRQQEEQLLQSLRTCLMEYARQAVAKARAEDDWINQNTSPLGKNAHLLACRSGRLGYRKVGKLLLVRRDEMNRFIEASGAAQAKRRETKGDEIDRELRALDFLRDGPANATTAEPRERREAGRR